MIIKRKITTLTTDANGQATYRYDSTGIGDVTFGATFEDDDSGLLTKTFTVQDCKFHDDASTDKSSDYTVRTTKNSTLTHNTGYYNMSGSAGGSGVGIMMGRSPTSLSTSENWIFEADIHSISGSQWKSISLILDSTHMVSCIVYTNKTFLLYDYGASAEITRTTFSTYDTNNYYRVKIKLENNVLYCGLYDTSDNLLCSMQGNLPSGYQNKTVYPSITQFANDVTANLQINFKNVKIKPL